MTIGFLDVVFFFNQKTTYEVRISDWSSDVFSSDHPFKELVDEKTESVDRSQATGARELGTDPKSGKPVSVRLGRYGPYAAIGSTAEGEEEKPRFASLR